MPPRDLVSDARRKNIGAVALHRPFQFHLIEAMKRKPIPVFWEPRPSAKPGDLPRLPGQDERDPRIAADHFLARVEAIVRTWIQEERTIRETIKAEAGNHGWTPQRKTAFDEACLTPETLAHRLDNISLSKLRRELRKLNAPTPGEIIRAVRMEYARHLLTHTRLLIREVAERAGYDNEKHFTERFLDIYGVTPSQFRRDCIDRSNGA